VGTACTRLHLQRPIELGAAGAELRLGLAGTIDGDTTWTVGFTRATGARGHTGWTLGLQGSF